MEGSDKKPRSAFAAGSWPVRNVAAGGQEADFAAPYLADRSCGLMDEPDVNREIAQIRHQLRRLEAEKAQLVSRLAELERDRPATPAVSTPRVESATTSAALTAASPSARKIDLFRRRFAGRSDVFPVRWENGPSGPAMLRPARTSG
jgi:hypothetical protein